MKQPIATYLSALLLLLSALVSHGVMAQGTDEQLADYYFENGQYEQARMYYEKLYKTNRSGKVYQNYLQTLIALGDFEESEKLIEKRLKSSQNQSDIYVELGELYQRFGKPVEAKEAYDDALKTMQPGRSNAIRLGNAFIKLNEYDYALATYERGKKMATDGYEFHYELANLQGIMGNYEGMLASFLDLLVISPNYIQTVQNSISRNLNTQEDDKNAEMVRTALLRQSQKYPNDPIFVEMLIWHFGQRKEFASAFVQANALDKRQGENGFRLMDLGRMAVSNGDYTTGRKAYQAVLDKGPANDYYITARTELLQVMREEILNKPGYTKEQILELQNAYQSAINDMGKGAQTAILMKELGHINAFYLNDIAGSIAVLEEAVDLPGLYPAVHAMIKLELGDVLLFKGEIWDASLLYSQVELDFKEDVLGHEAKFRNARISYYTGDFQWAQAQLDVLKASTSKLISNDAIDLSLLITDNLALDTITEPMLLFAQADLLAFQNRYNEAFIKLDSITTVYPGHSLTDEILLLKGDVFAEQMKYDEAVAAYQQVIDLHFDDILADDALFNLAGLKETVYANPEEAMQLYERIMVEYPGSLYVIEARKRFRTLRGDDVQ
jgi:tetratricopeptide (TPR) repeat protein